MAAELLAGLRAAEVKGDAPFYTVRSFWALQREVLLSRGAPQTVPLLRGVMER